MTPPIPLFSAGASLRSCSRPRPSASAAFTAGSTAYTKRFEDQPARRAFQALAPVNGKLRFASKLKVKEIRGNWVLIGDGSAKGWVFTGNLAETKPAEGTGLDKLGLSASTTTATAAAHPLTPAANDYAERRNLGDARGDLNWLNTECHAITNADVEKFLRGKKKGEYQ